MPHTQTFKARSLKLTDPWIVLQYLTSYEKLCWHHHFRERVLTLELEVQYLLTLAQIQEYYKKLGTLRGQGMLYAETVPEIEIEQGPMDSSACLYMEALESVVCPYLLVRRLKHTCSDYSTPSILRFQTLSYECGM